MGCMKYLIVILMVFLGVVNAGTLAAQVLAQNAADPRAATGVELRLRLGEHMATFYHPQGLVWGRSDASIRVVGFFDYTNPLDKRLFSDLPKLVEKHPELHIELRELPVRNASSLRLARFALATRMIHGEEGYRAMHLHLLRMLEVPSRHVLGLVAQEGRFDINRIEFAMDAAEITEQLQENQHLYLSIGQPQLPAFIAQDGFYSAVPNVHVLENLLFQR